MIFKKPPNNNGDNGNISISLFRLGSAKMNFGVGMCFPQSCSPQVLTKLVNEAIPAEIRDKISVQIQEKSCQFEETPSKLRIIDWMTM